MESLDWTLPVLLKGEVGAKHSAAVPGTQLHKTILSYFSVYDKESICTLRCPFLQGYLVMCMKLNVRIPC